MIIVIIFVFLFVFHSLGLISTNLCMYSGALDYVT